MVPTEQISVTSQCYLQKVCAVVLVEVMWYLMQGQQGQVTLVV